MNLYIFKAWKEYTRNIGLLVLTSLIITLIGLVGAALQVFAGEGIISALIGPITAILQTSMVIYAYQKIMGNYRGPKQTIIQGFWAWLSWFIISVIAVAGGLAITLLLLVTIIGAVLVPFAVAGILVILSKFIYINYLAAKEYDVVEILKRAWSAKLGVSLRAAIGMGVAAFIIIVLSIIPVIPMGMHIWNAVKTGVTAGSITYILQTLLNPQLFGILALGLMVNAALTPWIWMFPLASAKDALGE